MKNIVFILQVMALLITPFISSAQDTQGFFMNDQQPKKVIIPLANKIKQPTAEATVKADVDVKDTIARVSNLLYGNNTNPYMTQIVTEPKLLSQLQTLSPKILRFPGGNISNTYFWDAKPNHKPADVPDTILYGDKRKLRGERFWGGLNNNPSSLSLENYYLLLQKTNSTGTICVNAGYARYGTSTNPIATAAHYAANWVRFDKGRTRFWEVGNEDYGNWQAGYKIDLAHNKDNQPEITNGDLYGKIFKAFSDSMHAAAKENDKEIYVGATIIEVPRNEPYDKEVGKFWNRGFFKSAGNAADFFIVHSYYTPYNKNSAPAEILETATVVTDKMMQYLKDMAKEYNVQLKPVALTEWNIFSEGSKQQTSFISGMHAAIVLGELAKQKYGMACRWDLANGYNNGNDHGLFNKGDEPGMPVWSARPAYYYLYYFQQFFGDKLLTATSNDKNVLVYASTFSDDKMGIVLINKDSTDKIVSIHINHSMNKKNVYSYTITSGNEEPFSQKIRINGVGSSLPAGGPEDFKNIKADLSSFKNEVKMNLPGKAVQYLLIN